DATTNILPKADVKIVLMTNLLTCVLRKCIETGETMDNITANILQRDEKSYMFIENATKVSTSINTTYLSINQ
ncbi:27593_t:CDS:1, partial [Dentiscutata erythropus]